MRTPVYVAVALALIAFGVLGIFSIGAPFLLTGVVMLVVFRWRHRSSVLWPALGAVWAFVAGYILVAPLGCSASATNGVASQTRCDGIIFDYLGDDAPSLAPAVAVGLVAGVLVAFLLRRRLASRAEPTREPGSP